MHTINTPHQRPFASIISVAVAVSLALATTLAASFTVAPAQAQGCVQVDWDPNSCSSGAINNGSVDINGQTTNQASDPGTGGGSGSSGSDSGGASGGSGGASGGGDGPRELTFLEMCMQDAYFAAAVVECMAVVSQWTPGDPATPTAPPTPRVITLTDLASFTPQGVSLSLQPGAWTVVGVETNFIAGAVTHVVGGTLLGRSAEVRFTPASYEWNYGDGSTRSTADAGASWSALGLKEFSRTSTSHKYLTPASYTPSVTVYYSVEYRWGGGAWQTIAGRIPATASASTVTVFTADTVLVTGACTAWKTAPGC